METWFIVLVSLCVCVALKSLFSLLSNTNTSKSSRKLPPSPKTIPIWDLIMVLRKTFAEIEQDLIKYRKQFGSIFAVYMGSRPAVFITTTSAAHKALIQNGAALADRPVGPETRSIISSNQHTISSALYGPLWRVLRRNLSSEILQPARIKSWASGRKWSYQILKNKITSEAKKGEVIMVLEPFQHSMFNLFCFMCFGVKLEEKIVRQIEAAQHAILFNMGKFNSLNFFPGSFGKFIFRNRWKKFHSMRRDQEDVTIPLIKDREKKRNNMKKVGSAAEDEEYSLVPYVDSLLDLIIPDDGGRHLNDGEMVSLISEFINAGTHTSPTLFQWILANVIKNQSIQEKLYEEIERVVGTEAEIVTEEHLQKLPYLKAVVMEGLRRHPPLHFVLPHGVVEEITIDGYVIPKNANVNFLVAEMAWDPQVWKDPLEFKPERFLSEECDIIGTKEIKMMPFGAGRRVCPGAGLAIMHIEYFLANVVREFKWTAVDGDEIDLTPRQEFTNDMLYPLKAHATPRKAGLV